MENSTKSDERNERIKKLIKKPQEVKRAIRMYEENLKIQDKLKEQVKWRGLIEE